MAGRFSKDEEPVKKGGYLAAIQLTAPGQEQPVGALLVVQDPEGGDPGVYLVPPDVLLEGPNGEYVFAADAMAQGTLAQDLGRVVTCLSTPCTPSRSPTWAGGPPAESSRWTSRSRWWWRSTAARAPSRTVTSCRRRTCRPSSATRLGPLGRDRLEAALVKAALDAAALRPAAERAGLAGVSPSPTAGPALSEVLARITSGDAQVERLPSTSRVAEGQFAFVPDPEQIMAAVTRRSPAYHADVTVEVRNGSGRIGVGEAVAERLASLDVNLPAVLNADSFDYRQTQILAGPDTLPVARDIRAILGRGVVLDGTGLPKGTIQVIVGTTRLRKPARTNPKDQP